MDLNVAKMTIFWILALIVPFGGHTLHQYPLAVYHYAPRNLLIIIYWTEKESLKTLFSFWRWLIMGKEHWNSTWNLHLLYVRLRHSTTLGSRYHGNHAVTIATTNNGYLLATRGNKQTHYNYHSNHTRAIATVIACIWISPKSGHFLQYFRARRIAPPIQRGYSSCTSKFWYTCDISTYSHVPLVFISTIKRWIKLS